MPPLLALTFSLCNSKWSMRIVLGSKETKAGMAHYLLQTACFNLFCLNLTYLVAAIGY